MIVKAIRTRIFLEGENLVRFITKYVPKLPDRSILVVTSKIVALAEKRTAKYEGRAAKEKLIRAESEWAIRTKYVFATLKDGALVASAGIDESNANGKLIMLPKDSMRTAQYLRRRLMKAHRLNKLGILITDSRVAPLRTGVLGIAMGYAGFGALRDYRGTKDIFGRKLKYTQTNVADGLATAATLVMGEGKEQTPIAVIKNAPVQFKNKVMKHELRIDVRDDMYGPLFKSFPTRAGRKS